MVQQIIIGMEIKLRPEMRGWSFIFCRDFGVTCVTLSLVCHIFVNDHFDTVRANLVSTAKGCECSLDKSCSKISHETVCNCDSTLQNMIDIGTLTSMKQLPVMQLSYGGAFTTISSIQFDLGPLRCSGMRIYANNSRILNFVPFEPK